MILGTGKFLIIFLFGGLCWLLEMTNCVIYCPFFLSMNKRNSLAKNFENVLILKQNNLGEKSVAHMKLTFCFYIQVHGIEENIERQ